MLSGHLPLRAFRRAAKTEMNMPSPPRLTRKLSAASQMSPAANSPVTMTMLISTIKTPHTMMAVPGFPSRPCGLWLITPSLGGDLLLDLESAGSAPSAALLLSPDHERSNGDDATSDGLDDRGAHEQAAAAISSREVDESPHPAAPTRKPPAIIATPSQPA